MLYDMKRIIKDYNGRRVLDLSLSLKRSRVTGLIGPNGAGKTTLMEILAFLLSPTSGALFYKGDRVDFGAGDLIGLRRRAVLVQQKPILFTTTVFNNVEFPLRIRRVKRTEREGEVNRLLNMVGMGGFSRARADRLSGGEAQRVAIAMALACSPEVILMDEPTASVDVENRIIIEQIMRDINRVKGISVIFTTHDRIQASSIADDIIFIREGRITESDHENIFNGIIMTAPDGARYCVVRENLRIPISTERSGHVRISIGPDAVRVSRDPHDLENIPGLDGRIIQLSSEKGAVRMLVDVGVPLVIAMPPDSARDVIPGIGEDVRVLFNPEAITVF